MIIRLTQSLFAAFCRRTPGMAANAGYWLFRHPSAFNFKTPEEKSLLGKAASLRADAERIEIPAASALLWQWLPDGPAAARPPAVMLLHGWGGESGSMAQFATPLLELGYRVLIPDLPGHGRAPGRTVDTLASARAIVSIARDHGPVAAVIGHSLGAVLACLTAKGHETFGGGVPTQKLLLINGPKSLTSVIEGLGGAVGLAEPVIEGVLQRTESDFGQPLSVADAQSLLDQLDLPALAFHDRDDPFIPHATSLANLVRHPKLQVIVTEGLGHISILEDPVVIRQVADFIGPAR